MFSMSHCCFPPSYLTMHTLWWNGPNWLYQDSYQWSNRLHLPPIIMENGEREVHTTFISSKPLLEVGNYYSFTKLKRMTSWILRFVNNCRSRKLGMEPAQHTYLTIKKLHKAETLWYAIAQFEYFGDELDALNSGSSLNNSSQLISL